MDPKDYASVPWRVGRKVGRTIYAQLGPVDSDKDPLIGTLDTPELADEAVRAHNERLTSRERGTGLEPATFSLEG